MWRSTKLYFSLFIRRINEINTYWEYVLIIKVEATCKMVDTAKSRTKWGFFIPVAGRTQGWQVTYRKAAAELNLPPKTSLKSTPLVICLMQSRDMIAQLTEIYHKRMTNKTFFFTKFLGTQVCCEKVHIARYLNKVQPLLQSQTLVENIPTTFVLPDDLVTLQSWFSSGKKTVICKPEDGCQGDGIFIAQKWSDLITKMTGKSGVVQKYITKPLLLGGLKFDFRIYVCLLGCFDGPRPQVRAHLCKEGLARFCTKTYADIGAGGTTSESILGHLTNYSLNKRSKDYIHGDAHLSSKRTVSVALSQIRVEYPEFSEDAFWESLSELVTAWVNSILPILSATFATQSRELQAGNQEMDTYKINFSQILGFDVLLGRNFKLHLLEVNNSPSLNMDEVLPDPDGTCLCMDHHEKHYHQPCEVDIEVKSIVASGLFQLIMGGRECEFLSQWFIEMEGLHNPLSSLTNLHSRFAKRFGTNNIFAGSNLRKIFSSLINASTLMTADLDLIATKLKFENQYYVDGSPGTKEMKELSDLVGLLEAVREKCGLKRIIDVLELLE